MSRLFLLGVGKGSEAPFRETRVGVLAAEVGVFARDVGVVALEALPFAWGRFKVDGEFDRVDAGLDWAELPSFLTDRGSFDDVVGAGLFIDEGGPRVTSLREMGAGACCFCIATSLRDRACVRAVEVGWGCGVLSWVSTLRYQPLGDDGSTSGSDKLR